MLDVIVGEGGELVTALGAGGGQVGDVADGRGERAHEAEGKDEEEEEAEPVGPDVDGVIVEREEGRVEAGAQGGEVRAVRAGEVVVVAHPCREFAEREQAGGEVALKRGGRGVAWGVGLGSRSHVGARGAGRARCRWWWEREREWGMWARVR